MDVFGILDNFFGVGMVYLVLPRSWRVEGFGWDRMDEAEAVC